MDTKYHILYSVMWWKRLAWNLYLHMQAVVDAEGSQKAQEAWLKENLQPHFARKLLRMVSKISKLVLAGDGNPEHAFPQLAGSHLSAVSHCHTHFLSLIPISSLSRHCLIALLRTC